jgi:hypothetical protein
MTDAIVGWEWLDPKNRVLKSASSKWTGTLESKHISESLKIGLSWLTTLAGELKTWFWHEASYDQDVNRNMSDHTMENKNRIRVALQHLVWMTGRSRTGARLSVTQSSIWMRTSKMRKGTYRLRNRFMMLMAKSIL